MKNFTKFGIIIPMAATLFLSLGNCSSSTTGTEEVEETGTTGTLSSAFDAFDKTNVQVTLSGNKVIIKTNGRPNHTSPYWSNTTARSMDGITTVAAATNHALFINPAQEATPSTTFAQMAPGNIDDFNGSYTLSVNASPTKATNSSATGLGAIGISVSGAVIYNDEEGPGIALANAVGSLDYNGAHTGPQSYHYHLEPKSWSNNDSKLIGIISDGFFLFGRKCSSTGTYPTNLDASGGHTSTTQYSTTATYHYHTSNDLYLSKYYILFPGNYQGTPNSIQ